MDLIPNQIYYSVLFMDGGLSVPLIQSLVFRRYEDPALNESERWLLFDQVSIGNQSSDGLLPIRLDESTAEVCICDLTGLRTRLQEIASKNRLSNRPIRDRRGRNARNADW